MKQDNIEFIQFRRLQEWKIKVIFRAYQINIWEALILFLEYESIRIKE